MLKREMATNALSAVSLSLGLLALAKAYVPNVTNPTYKILKVGGEGGGIWTNIRKTTFWFHCVEFPHKERSHQPLETRESVKHCNLP